MPYSFERLDLLGIPVHRVTSEQLLEFVKETVRERNPTNILHLNIHGVCLALQRTWLRHFYQSHHLLFCDGEGARWGLRFLGISDPPPKIPLTRWIWDLAGYSEKHGFKIYLLGAKPGVPEEAAKQLNAKYPKLQFAGLQHGYFSKEGPENEKVIERINQSGADILIVCFGMPEQERWLLENNHKLKTPVRIPSGGAMDYVAGRLGKVPDWMIRFHLEWLFRIMEEPQRLLGRYLVEIPYFLFRIISEKMRRVLFRADAE
jgi:N-acetylglucosaminyldiphosphoundecaprenol N-acetyl-beta-D-mannosaminyltransferase